MYDVLIIGAGPGGIFATYELMEKNPKMKIAVFEMGHELKKRHCPIDGEKIKSCIHCKSCSIMSGFGGAGAFSDGKFNIKVLGEYFSEGYREYLQNPNNLKEKDPKLYEFIESTL